MNVAGFESSGYFGFVVSDLSQAATLQIADALVPPLKTALENVGPFEARVGLDDVDRASGSVPALDDSL